MKRAFYLNKSLLFTILLACLSLSLLSASIVSAEDVDWSIVIKKINEGQLRRNKIIRLKKNNTAGQVLSEIPRHKLNEYNGGENQIIQLSEGEIKTNGTTWWGGQFADAQWAVIEILGPKRKIILKALFDSKLNQLQLPREIELSKQQGHNARKNFRIGKDFAKQSSGGSKISATVTDNNPLPTVRQKGEPPEFSMPGSEMITWEEFKSSVKYVIETSTECQIPLVRAFDKGLLKEKCADLSGEISRFLLSHEIHLSSAKVEVMLQAIFRYVDANTIQFNFEATVSPVMELILIANGAQLTDKSTFVETKGINKAIETLQGTLMREYSLHVDSKSIEEYLSSFGRITWSEFKELVKKIIEKDNAFSTIKMDRSFQRAVLAETCPDLVEKIRVELATRGIVTETRSVQFMLNSLFEIDPMPAKTARINFDADVTRLLESIVNEIRKGLGSSDQALLREFMSKDKYIIDTISDRLRRDYRLIVDPMDILDFVLIKELQLKVEIGRSPLKTVSTMTKKDWEVLININWGKLKDYGFRNILEIDNEGAVVARHEKLTPENAEAHDGKRFIVPMETNTMKVFGRTETIAKTAGHYVVIRVEGSRFIKIGILTARCHPVQDSGNKWGNILEINAKAAQPAKKPAPEPKDELRLDWSEINKFRSAPENKNVSKVLIEESTGGIDPDGKFKRFGPAELNANNGRKLILFIPKGNVASVLGIYRHFDGNRAQFWLVTIEGNAFREIGVFKKDGTPDRNNQNRIGELFTVAAGKLGEKEEKQPPKAALEEKSAINVEITDADNEVLSKVQWKDVRALRSKPGMGSRIIVLNEDGSIRKSYGSIKAAKGAEPEGFRFVIPIPNSAQIIREGICKSFTKAKKGSSVVCRTLPDGTYLLLGVVNSLGQKSNAYSENRGEILGTPVAGATTAATPPIPQVTDMILDFSSVITNIVEARSASERESYNNIYVLNRERKVEATFEQISNEQIDSFNGKTLFDGKTLMVLVKGNKISLGPLASFGKLDAPDGTWALIDCREGHTYDLLALYDYKAKAKLPVPSGKETLTLSITKPEAPALVEKTEEIAPEVTQRKSAPNEGIEHLSSAIKEAEALLNQIPATSKLWDIVKLPINTLSSKLEVYKAFVGARVTGEALANAKTEILTSLKAVETALYSSTDISAATKGNVATQLYNIKQSLEKAGVIKQAGLTNVATGLQREVIGESDLLYLQIETYIKGKNGLIFFYKEGDPKLIDARGRQLNGMTYYDESQKRIIIRLLKGADGSVKMFALMQELVHFEIISRALKSKVIGPEMVAELQRGLVSLDEAEHARSKGVKNMIELDTYELAKRLSNANVYEIAGILKREVPDLFKKYEAKAVELMAQRRVKEGKSETIEDAMAAVEKKMRRAGMVENIKSGAKDLVTGKPARFTGEIFKSILFITILEVANMAKDGLPPGVTWESLSAKEQMDLLIESAGRVVNSVDIFAGMAGAGVAGKLPKEMMKVSNLKGLRAQIAGQALSVITYAGWVTTSQLYADVCEGLPVEAHNVTGLLWDARIRDMVWQNLKRHVSSGKYKKSLELAVYNGLLTGDAVFFLGFTAAGSWMGGTLGTIAFPGAGTLIGQFLGGAAGAVASIWLPEDVKSPITDAFSYVEQFLGSNKADMNSGRISRYAAHGDSALLKGAIDEMIDGRNNALHAMLGRYARNLQLWIATDAMLSRYEFESEYLSQRGFAAYNNQFPSRRILRTNKPELSDALSPQNLGNVPPRLLNAREVRESIDTDISTSASALAIYEENVRSAWEAIDKVLDKETFFLMGVSANSRSELIKKASANIARVKEILTSRLSDIDLLKQEIEGSREAGLESSERALSIMPALLQHGFTRQRLELAINPKWADPDNIMYFKAVNE